MLLATAIQIEMPYSLSPVTDRARPHCPRHFSFACQALLFRNQVGVLVHCVYDLRNRNAGRRMRQQNHLLESNSIQFNDLVKSPLDTVTSYMNAPPESEPRAVGQLAAPGARP